MSASAFIETAKRLISNNSPAILSSIGVVGTISTAYLASKASVQAAEVIRDDIAKNKEPGKRYFRKHTDDIKLVWKLYIPTGISGAVTIAAIIGSNKISSNRAASAVVAYSLVDRAFSEYKEKVVEEIGKTKEQGIRDNIASEKVTNTAPGEGVVLVGSGHVLCCELYTGRYFQSDSEILRRAQNEVNARAMRHLYATLDDFYDLVGLDTTAVSGNLGWDSDKLMELSFTSVLMEGRRPALAFDYNYVKPIH